TSRIATGLDARVPKSREGDADDQDDDGERQAQGQTATLALFPCLDLDGGPLHARLLQSFLDGSQVGGDELRYDAGMCRPVRRLERQALLSQRHQPPLRAPRGQPCAAM